MCAQSRRLNINAAAKCKCNDDNTASSMSGRGAADFASQANSIDLYKRSSDLGYNKIFKWGKRRLGGAETDNQYLRPIDNINRRIFRWGKRSAGYTTHDDAAADDDDGGVAYELQHDVSNNENTNDARAAVRRLNDQQRTSEIKEDDGASVTSLRQSKAAARAAQGNSIEATVDITNIPLDDVYMDPTFLSSLWKAVHSNNNFEAPNIDVNNYAHDDVSKRTAASQRGRIFKWGKRDDVATSELVASRPMPASKRAPPQESMRKIFKWGR